MKKIGRIVPWRSLQKLDKLMEGGRSQKKLRKREVEKDFKAGSREPKKMLYP